MLNVFRGFSYYMKKAEGSRLDINNAVAEMKNLKDRRYLFFFFGWRKRLWAQRNDRKQLNGVHREPDWNEAD